MSMKRIPCVTEDFAETTHLNKLMDGKRRPWIGPSDHDQNQHDVRKPRIKGFAHRSGCRSSLDGSLRACEASGAPPNPRIVLGRQIFTNTNKTQNETSAPLKSGKIWAQIMRHRPLPQHIGKEPTIASGHASSIPFHPLTR